MKSRDFRKIFLCFLFVQFKINFRKINRREEIISLIGDESGEISGFEIGSADK